MLIDRLSQEDCNAGAIFDCLESEYWPDSKFAIELIAEAVPKQNLQVIMLRFQRDTQNAESGEEPAEVCTNYRYARRKASAQNANTNEEKPAGEAAPVEGGKKRTKGKAAAATKPGKRGQKAPTKEDEER